MGSATDSGWPEWRALLVLGALTAVAMAGAFGLRAGEVDGVGGRVSGEPKPSDGRVVTPAAFLFEEPPDGFRLVSVSDASVELDAQPTLELGSSGDIGSDITLTISREEIDQIRSEAEGFGVEITEFTVDGHDGGYTTSFGAVQGAWDLGHGLTARISAPGAPLLERDDIERLARSLSTQPKPGRIESQAVAIEVERSGLPAGLEVIGQIVGPVEPEPAPAVVASYEADGDASITVTTIDRSHVDVDRVPGPVGRQLDESTRVRGRTGVVTLDGLSWLEDGVEVSVAADAPTPSLVDLARLLEPVSRRRLTDLRQASSGSGDVNSRALSGSWTEFGAGPHAPRSGHPIVVGSESDVVVFGGEGPAASFVDAASFDVTAERWRRLPPPPTAHSTGVADAVGDRIVFVTTDSIGEPPFEAMALDVATDRWLELPPPPVGEHRSIVAHAAVRDAFVLITAPSSRGPLDGPLTAVALDAVSGMWRQLDRPPVRVTNAVLAPIGGDRAVLLGAHLSGSNAAVGDSGTQAVELDASNGSWRPLPDPDLIPQSTSAAFDGKRLIAVSYFSTDPASAAPGAVAFDPNEQRWTELPPMPVRAGECYVGTTDIGSSVYVDYCGQAANWDGAWHAIEPPAAAGVTGTPLGIAGPPVQAGDAAWSFVFDQSTGRNRLLRFDPPGAE